MKMRVNVWTVRWDHKVWLLWRDDRCIEVAVSGSSTRSVCMNEFFFLRKCKNKFEGLIYEMNWNRRLCTLWLDSCQAICIDNCSFLRLLYLYTVLYFTWTWKWSRRGQNGVRFYRWCLLQNLYQRNLILKIILDELEPEQSTENITWSVMVNKPTKLKRSLGSYILLWFWQVSV